LKNFIHRIAKKYRLTLSHMLNRRIISVNLSVPIISFSFDDAPRSAFNVGGKILRAHGARATYYVSLGLLGEASASGPIASQDDLRAALAEGHELGCHTYDHRDAWLTPAREFERSILRNREALAMIQPGVTFTTHAYPISNPRPSTKARVEKFFDCCRGGGQTFNRGPIDLSLVKAYFLDRRINMSLEGIKKLIECNAACRGWLIFATHDVDVNPSHYGCSPYYFSSVVDTAANSGAALLSVGEAYKRIQECSSHGKKYSK
jgi:hypothetical protein